KDIALILGDDIANKVYPDERVKPKAYSRLFNSFNNVVIKKVEEQGFFVQEAITDEKIRATLKGEKKQRWLKAEEKLKYIKQFSAAIKSENDYTTKRVKKEEEKLKYGFTKKKPVQITVFKPKKN
ncbi:phosphoglycerate dehydrogenase-like enzyme, partial [Priestia aryabhattai]|uniref:hypothetical protein n=1 Tax=Priestia aryabhattai TaxID=412384 RepID=UPI0027E49F49